LYYFCKPDILDVIKKLFHISFISIYLLVSAGVAVSMHHCHDHVSLKPLALHEDSCCCEHEESIQCCYNNTLYLHLDTYQHPTNPARILAFIHGIQEPLFSTPEALGIPVETGFTGFVHDIVRKNPLWLQHVSLILYA